MLQYIKLKDYLKKNINIPHNIFINQVKKENFSNDFKITLIITHLFKDSFHSLIMKYISDDIDNYKKFRSEYGVSISLNYFRFFYFFYVIIKYVVIRYISNYDKLENIFILFLKYTKKIKLEQKKKKLVDNICEDLISSYDYLHEITFIKQNMYLSQRYNTEIQKIINLPNIFDNYVFKPVLIFKDHKSNKFYKKHKSLILDKNMSLYCTLQNEILIQIPIKYFEKSKFDKSNLFLMTLTSKGKEKIGYSFILSDNSVNYGSIYYNSVNGYFWEKIENLNTIENNYIDQLIILKKVTLENVNHIYKITTLKKSKYRYIYYNKKYSHFIIQKKKSKIKNDYESFMIKNDIENILEVEKTFINDSPFNYENFECLCMMKDVVGENFKKLKINGYIYDKNKIHLISPENYLIAWKNSLYGGNSVFKIDNLCLKKLGNDDTEISERLCLIVDNCILLTNHYDTYNFLGGRVPFKYLSYNVGKTSLKELKEELGLIINPNINIRLLSWYFANCLRIVVIIQITKEDIKFSEATHVWESKDFTLIPILDNNLDNNDDLIKLGNYLENGIRNANKKCSTFIKYDVDNKKIIKITDKKGKKIIKQDNKTYFIPLTETPDLDKEGNKNLEEINELINGYKDRKYVFKKDYICEYKYIPFKKNIKLTISKNLSKNLGIYDIDYNYFDLIKYFYGKGNKELLSKKKDEESVKIIKKINDLFF